jgi:hypothetical protein
MSKAKEYARNCLLRSVVDGVEVHEKRMVIITMKDDN